MSPYPTTYAPRVVTPPKTEAEKSMERAKAEIEGQKRALKAMEIR